MTFDDIIRAMKEDAKACNERAGEIFRPKVALEANICPVCGKEFIVRGYKTRVTCSNACAQQSRSSKLAVQLKEKRIDELLEMRKAG